VKTTRPRRIDSEDAKKIGANPSLFFAKPSAFFDQLSSSALGASRGRSELEKVLLQHSAKADKCPGLTEIIVASKRALQTCTVLAGLMKFSL